MNLNDLNLKIYAKIIAKASLKWSLIFIPGIFICLICLIWGVKMLLNNSILFGAPHAGGALALIMGILMLYLQDPFVMLMLSLNTFLFPVIYFLLANKKAMNYTIESIWEQKLQTWFNNKIESYLNKNDKERNRIVDKLDKFGTTKIALLHAIKNDNSTGKWQKKILNFIIKQVDSKAQLDLASTEGDFSNVVIEKINTVINDITTPSNIWFYVTVTIHLIILVISVLLDFK